jgi:chromosomal replication initiator protein
MILYIPMPLFEPDYTFKHFVVTPNNELAFAAAAAIAKDPGSRYNPFFLYGDFGSGKTHLLHAVANAIREEGTPGMRIMYVTGKDFAADMPRTRNVRRPANYYPFYRPYGACDFLMIDGFEALGDDDVAQNAAIRLFDMLFKEKKQIMITSALPAHHFPVILEYFRNSYDTGLVGDIRAPESLVKHRELLWG